MLSTLLIGPARVLIPIKLGLPGLLPLGLAEGAPITPGAMIAWCLAEGLFGVFVVLGIVFFLILVRRLVRVGWLAGLIVTLLFSTLSLGNGGIVWVPALLAWAALVFMTVRYGVLAGVVSQTSFGFIAVGLRTGDPSSWMFYAGMIAVALVAAIGVWGAKTALAGKPLFGEASVARLEEA
jgi:hypothetical protein